MDTGLGASGAVAKEVVFTTAETTDTDTERMAAIRNQGRDRMSRTSAGGLITKEMEEDNDEETNEDDDINTRCWDQRLAGKKKMKKQTTLTGKKKKGKMQKFTTAIYLEATV